MVSHAQLEELSLAFEARSADIERIRAKHNTIDETLSDMARSREEMATKLDELESLVLRLNKESSSAEPEHIHLGPICPSPAAVGDNNSTIVRMTAPESPVPAGANKPQIPLDRGKSSTVVRRRPSLYTMF